MKRGFLAFTMVITALTGASSALARQERPMFDRVALAPTSIGVTPIPGVSPGADEASVVATLQREATERAAADLVKDGIAREVATVASGGMTPVDLPVVTVQVSLPVTIPDSWLGMPAYNRHDWFAAATVNGADVSGISVLTQRAPIRWSDLSWCQHTWNRAGMWHTMNRPVKDVLMSAVDGTIDRAIQRASSQVRSR